MKGKTIDPPCLRSAERDQTLPFLAYSSRFLAIRFLKVSILSANLSAVALTELDSRDRPQELCQME